MHIAIVFTYHTFFESVTHPDYFGCGVKKKVKVQGVGRFEFRILMKRSAQCVAKKTNNWTHLLPLFF